jgi:hypothetical protein
MTAAASKSFTAVLVCRPRNCATATGINGFNSLLFAILGMLAR